MVPEAEHFYDAFVGQNLVNKPVLDIDPSGERATKTAQKGLMGRRCSTDQ